MTERDMNNMQIRISIMKKVRQSDLYETLNRKEKRMVRFMAGEFPKRDSNDGKPPQDANQRKEPTQGKPQKRPQKAKGSVNAEQAGNSKKKPQAKPNKARKQNEKDSELNNDTVKILAASWGAHVR